MSQVPECIASEPEDEASEAVLAPPTLLFAIATGVIITNLFAPQTLVGIIGPSLGFSESGAGLVAMASLLGYAAGLFFLVPLADLIAVVGSLIIAGERESDLTTILGTVAVAASMTNIVSGFLITDRMLKMFRERERKP